MQKISEEEVIGNTYDNLQPADEGLTTYKPADPVKATVHSRVVGAANKISQSLSRTYSRCVTPSKLCNKHETLLDSNSASDESADIVESYEPGVKRTQKVRDAMVTGWYRSRNSFSDMFSDPNRMTVGRKKIKPLPQGTWPLRSRPIRHANVVRAQVMKCVVSCFEDIPLEELSRLANAIVLCSGTDNEWLDNLGLYQICYHAIGGKVSLTALSASLVIVYNLIKIRGRQAITADVNGVLWHSKGFPGSAITEDILLDGLIDAYISTLSRYSPYEIRNNKLFARGALSGHSVEVLLLRVIYCLSQGGSEVPSSPAHVGFLISLISRHLEQVKIDSQHVARILLVLSKLIERNPDQRSLDGARTLLVSICVNTLERYTTKPDSVPTPKASKSEEAIRVESKVREYTTPILDGVEEAASSEGPLTLSQHASLELCDGVEVTPSSDIPVTSSQQASLELCDESFELCGSAEKSGLPVPDTDKIYSKESKPIYHRESYASITSTAVYADACLQSLALTIPTNLLCHTELVPIVMSRLVESGTLRRISAQAFSANFARYPVANALIFSNICHVWRCLALSVKVTDKTMLARELKDAGFTSGFTNYKKFYNTHRFRVLGPNGHDTLESGYRHMILLSDCFDILINDGDLLTFDSNWTRSLIA